MGYKKGGNMNRKKVTIRLKNIIIEAVNLIHVEENKTVQSVYEELIELGLMEYMKRLKGDE